MTINPIRAADAIAYAARQWRQESAEPYDMEDLIRWLLAEAARTERTWSRPRPQEYGDAWPDIVWTRGEIEAAANERLTEAREAAKAGRVALEVFSPTSDAPAGPSADAVSRADEVLNWLRLIPAGPHKPLRMKMVLAIASGVGPTRIIHDRRFAVLGYRNRQACHEAFARSIRRIEAALRDANVTTRTLAA